MNPKKNRELFLHWLLTISGGFMGAYSIIALGGNFTNAITGNMINFMRSLSGGDGWVAEKTVNHMISKEYIAWE